MLLMFSARHAATSADADAFQRGAIALFLRFSLRVVRCRVADASAMPALRADYTPRRAACHVTPRDADADARYAMLIFYARHADAASALRHYATALSARVATR